MQSSKVKATLNNRDVTGLAPAFDDAGVDIVKTGHLYEFDGKPGYFMGHDP